MSEGESPSKTYSRRPRKKMAKRDSDKGYVSEGELQSKKVVFEEEPVIFPTVEEEGTVKEKVQEKESPSVIHTELPQDEPIVDTEVHTHTEPSQETTTSMSQQEVHPEPEPTIISSSSSEDDTTLAERFKLQKRKREEEEEDTTKNKGKAPMDAKELQALEARELALKEDEKMAKSLQMPLDEYLKIKEENLLAAEELRKEAIYMRSDTIAAKMMAEEERKKAAKKDKKLKAMTVEDTQAKEILSLKEQERLEKEKAEIEQRRKQRLDNMDRKRLQDVAKRRMKKEPITKVVLNMSRTRKEPHLTITRGSIDCGEGISLGELGSYGYTEWLEIRRAIEKSKSKCKEEVLKDLHRRFDKVRSLNIDLSGAHDEEGEEQDITPLVRRKKEPLAPSTIQGLTARQLMLKINEEGGILGNLNKNTPAGIKGEDGLFIEKPEHGLFYLDQNKMMCFQRTSELTMAPIMHILTLKWVCNKPENLQRSKGYIHFLEKAAKEMGADLNKPEGLLVKQELEAKASGFH